MGSRLRLVVACLASALILVPLGWLWWSSLMPDEYSVMDMGYVDLGGGPTIAALGPDGAGHRGGHRGEEAVSITTLVADENRPADVRVDLTAREETFRLATGETVAGYTLNGSSPGPTVRATQGDLVEVRLSNADVADGVTLHWHGVDVPNAVDGVAGVTQDAVAPGERHVYRFVAEQTGTYWYHSHQVSHEQVRKGLFGALVVSPSEPRRSVTDLDLEAVGHVYGGLRTVNGRTGTVRVDAAPGDTARVRVVNTDNGALKVWVSGTDYRVLAVDGTDVHRPGLVEDRSLALTAGARADLEITVPDDGARVELGGGSAVVLAPPGADPEPEPAPTDFVDLLHYGEPAPLGFDPASADRSFDYEMGRRPGFLRGRPGVWWTINGHMWPDVPMFTVSRGDVVRMRIENDSGEAHPMHLHGHHAVVLSRDGEAATGSPWWVDSLDVQAGETYEVAFVADNPGVWMDHCHNLPHAVEGLVAHLMYAGYTTPYRIGGHAHNEPE